MALQSWSKLPLTLGLFLAIAYGGICMGLRFWQHRLMFNPSPVLAETPAQLQLDYQEVWLSLSSHSPDEGEKIHGWWLGAPPSSEEAKVLLYLHGNTGNLSSNLKPIQRYQQLGFSVLAIDYRGYGRSSDRFPNESQVYGDAEAALQYLVRDRGISPEDIFIYGHSLGGAIAIETAKRHPNIAGLIVEGSFTSMLAVVTRRKSYAIFPVDWLLTQRFNSIEKVKYLPVPMLFIHGLEDGVIPAHMSEQLYQAARAPKQLYLVPNAAHSNVGLVGGEEYLQTVRQFVQGVRTGEAIGL